MRKEVMVLLAGVSFAAAAGSASAQIVPVTEPVQDMFHPISGPYQIIGDALLAPGAGILYSSTAETASRFNPGTGGNPTGSGVQQDIVFDDVPIPNARLGGANAVDVTRVTVGIRRAGNAPATDINLFWATTSTQVVAPDTELDVPFFSIGTVGLEPRNTGSFITELVSIGDGDTVLFTAPLNSTLFNGFGTFMLGLQFSSGDNLNGWRLTSGSDTNANVMWIYDTDSNPAEGAFNFGGTPSATFYLIVEGTPVPEPATLGLLAGLAVMGMRRRI